MTRIKTISLLNAYSIVQQALAIGFFTPARSGDFVFRVLKSEKNKSETGYSVFVSRFAQLFATVIFGSVGSIYGVLYMGYEYYWTLIPLCVIIGFGLLYFNIKTFGRLLKFNWFASINKAMACYNKTDMLITLCMSVLRYLVFALQYYLLCIIVGFDISSVLIITGITSVFVLKSAVPFINIFGELGLRESAAILLFTMFLGVNQNIVLQSSLVLWFVNLVLPVLVGLGIFTVSKFKTK